MMKRMIALAGLVGLTACSGGIQMPDIRGARPAPTPTTIAPPTPQPTLMTAKERLVNAIEDNGCALTAGNVGTVLTEATISQSELTSLVPQLEAEGRAEVAGTDIRILSDRCI